MTTLNVAVLPGDNGGCGTYRLIEPAAAVAQVRPDWAIRVYQPRGELQVRIDQHGRVHELRNLDPFPDVMVMQRTGTPVLAGVAKYLQDRGVAIVADFDDAMWCIDRGNVAYGSWNNPSRHRGQHWSICDRVAGHADLVTVTTDRLGRRYGAHGRVEVLPNRIPDRWVVPQPAVDGVPSGGWSGYTATHPGDCAVAAPAARVFLEEGAGLRVMADSAGAAREWGVDAARVDPVAATDTLGVEYFAQVARVGVMLVGLKDSTFNQCKSTLKVLEAAAAGVPSIASETGPYRQLARSGFPVRVAASAAEWERHARELLDPSVYQEARHDLLQARSQIVMSAQAEAWAQAWERARARRDRIG